MQKTELISSGSWIKRRRKELDLTQGELAKQVGCAIVTIQKIEANQRRPSKQMANLLAKHLELPTELYQEFVNFARGTSSPQRFVARYELGRRTVTDFTKNQLTNIPAPPTRLIGRNQEVSDAKRHLLHRDTRLLSIVGPPGVGKTRLAIQVASSLQDDFYDGAHFVSLSPVNNPKMVASTIAQMIGVNRIGSLSFEDRLIEYLRDKHVLLVLDNFEQVAAAAPFIANLLTACHWLSILVTSRKPLTIRGEQQLPLSPLALPIGDDLEVVSQKLASYSAIKLFIERSRAVNPDFILNEENSKTILDICRRLDGLPLAIELAASRIGFLTPQALLEQISGPRALHMDGLRDVPSRHRTLYHAIDWSYDLLTPDEQLLLRHLSVFRSGWTTKAVEGLMPNFPTADLEKILISLVKNHLVEQYEYHGGTRFTLLETIRSFAQQRLIETGEEVNARQRHADYHLALAEEADPHLRTSEQLVWLDRLEAERSNLQASLSWFIDQARDAEPALRLAGALSWFWIIRCYLSEAQEWLTKALKIGTSADPKLRARVLHGSGSIAWFQGDVAVARSHMEESVSLFKDLGPSQRRNLAWALTGLAMVAAYQAEYEATRAAANEAVSISRQIKDEWMVGLALCAKGEACMMRQDYAGARSSFDESSTLFRSVGDKYGLGAALLDWGYLDSIQDNHAEACHRLSESIEILRQIGERWMRAITLNILGQVVQQQGDYSQATRYFSESLDLLKKMGIENNIGDVLFNLAQLTHSQGHFDLAKRLYEECSAMFMKQGHEDKAAKCYAAVKKLESR
jgi:predicted ATPase/DNA-binding XRE family transcriptional regulator